MILRRKATFTLVELVVSLLIFSFISITLFTLFQVGSSASKSGVDELLTYNYLKKEYSILEKEYKGAKTTIVNDNQLFIVNDKNEEVVYNYENKTLFKNSEPFIKNVDELHFYEENSNTLRMKMVLSYQNKKISLPMDFYINKRH